MEEEYMISGYCRCTDQARTVLLEWTGDGWESDCGYPGCTFQGECPVAVRLREIEAGTEQA